MSQFSWHQILQKEYKLVVDASDTGAGSVLLQEDMNGVDHPYSYFFPKNEQTSKELFYNLDRMFVSHSCSSKC